MAAGIGSSAMATMYEYGRNLEYRIVNFLRDKGCLAHRMYGSRGAFDVWAIFDTEVWLIQCKRSLDPYVSKDVRKQLGEYEKRFKIVKCFIASIGKDLRDKRKVPIIFEPVNFNVELEGTDKD